MGWGTHRFVPMLLPLAAGLALHGCQAADDGCDTAAAEPKYGIGTLEGASEGLVLSFQDANGMHSVPLEITASAVLSQPLNTIAGHRVVFEGTLVDQPVRCGFQGAYGRRLRITRLSVVD